MSKDRWECRIDGERVGAVYGATEEDARKALVTYDFLPGIELVQKDDVGSPIGWCYRAWERHVYLCVAHDKRSGFWMEPVTPGQGERRNISERAINRTYHYVYRPGE